MKPNIGDTRLRYPDGDPENGPAIRHTWDGIQWVPPDEPDPVTDRRWEKRFLRRMYGTTLPITDAFDRGNVAAYCGRLYRNPYPPGLRHKAFRDGYNHSRSTTEKAT